jgi:hypothetical protein
MESILTVFATSQEIFSFLFRWTIHAGTPFASARLIDGIVPGGVVAQVKLILMGPTARA